MPSTHYRKIKKGRQAYHHQVAPLPTPTPPTGRRFPSWLWILAAAVVALLSAAAVLQ